MALLRPLAVAAAVIAPLGAAPLASAQSIAVSGSSTVYPISSAVAEAFAADTGANVKVESVGTGGGFKAFAKGETDISNASRPIKFKEHEALVAAGIDYVEIPVAYDGLSIVTNKANSWAGKLTVDQLRTIFTEGGANTWDEVDPAFPNVPIKIYAPGEASGTYDYFKEVISGKDDKYGALRSDMSKSEDDNVLVNGVAGETGAIGFFGVAYYEENRGKLNAALIENGAGDYIGPEASTIEDGTYNPFSRPLFIYVSTKSLERPEVADFIDFYLEEGPELAEEVGYVRLPPGIYDAAMRKVENHETGSAFMTADGEKLHGSTVELYK